jgi:predicted site-specific integrase-resolvase
MSTTPLQPERDRLLKVHEIATEMQADEKTVYRRIQSGKLKAAFKEGGRWMIWRSHLLAYLNGGGSRA